MKSQVRVAVIGGGVVGCSVLYHLTKLGWSDVVLIERSELTSGSTWLVLLAGNNGQKVAKKRSSAGRPPESDATRDHRVVRYRLSEY